MLISNFGWINWILALVLISLALYCLRYRRTVQALAMTTGLTLAALWSFCDGAYFASVTPAQKLFWTHFSAIAACFIPLIWLITALQHTGRGRLLSWSRLLGLSLIPLITLLLDWTGDRNQLFRFNPRLVMMGSLPVLAFDTGLWYWIHVLYNYVLVGAAIVMLFVYWRHAQGIYRQQSLLLLVGMLFPLGVSIIFSVATNYAFRYDPEPVGFLITGCCFALSLVRYRYLDIVPVARGTVVENMSDLMLVLDMNNRLLDFNPAAQRVLQANLADSIGGSVDVVMPKWPELVKRYPPSQTARDEINMEDADGQRTFDLSISPILDRRGNVLGRLVIMRDITDRKLAEEALWQVHEDLRKRMVEIETLQASLQERVVRDHLTGLFNRRYLEETLPRELARAARRHYPVSLAFIDLDHFKKVNDRFGHKAGDAVLRTLGIMLVSNTRREDIACRYGGEEFAIVFPDMPLEVAFKRAEELRAQVADLEVEQGGEIISFTISIGVSIFPECAQSDEDLLATADQALYNAKSNGRNRVVAFEEGMTMDQAEKDLLDASRMRTRPLSKPD